MGAADKKLARYPHLVDRLYKTLRFEQFNAEDIREIIENLTELNFTDNGINCLATRTNQFRQLVKLINKIEKLSETNKIDEIEVLKMIDLFGFSKHVMNNFYQYFRTIIYEQQKNELVKYFEKSPKIPQERIYMNTKVYLYLYEHKLFVSDKYLISKDARKHTNDERLEIKNIYLRSYRKVLSRSFAHRFHLHLAEELWKYGKDFSERYSGINTLLFA